MSSMKKLLESIDQIEEANISDDNLISMLDQIIDLSNHQIPYYAYGNNEAATELANRLNNIQNIATQMIGEIRNV